jgi:hypothetical protein
MTRLGHGAVAAATRVIDGSAHEGKIIQEFRAGEHRVLIEGGSAEDQGTVAQLIRGALDVVRGRGLDSETPDSTYLVAYDRGDIDEANRLLDRALEVEACRAAIVKPAAPLNTDDSESVQRLVDQIDERPHEFAIRFLTSSRFANQLHTRVEEVERRLGIATDGVDRPIGAAR